MRVPTDLIAVLAYHKVGEVPEGGWESWYRIPEPVFAEQLAYLDTHGWEVLTAARFLAALDAPELVPSRAALITFDDGDRSVREVALPCLARFGFPAVAFVPTGFVGAVNSFDAGVEHQQSVCDWDDLRALESAGISIQSHGVSHRAFSDLDSADRDDELRRSKAALEEGLAKPIELFAYPYGDAGPGGEVQEAMRSAGYRAAFLYKGGAARLPVRDAYRLPRIAMGPDTDLREVLDLG